MRKQETIILSQVIKFNETNDIVGLKVDGSNAYNVLKRYRVLQSVKKHNPDGFIYDINCYQTPGILYVHGTDATIDSANGVQQGGPVDIRKI